MVRTKNLLLTAGLLLGTGGLWPAHGQNQVRRDRFDFEVLRTEHFDIHFYAEGAELAPVAGRMAERWYARLSRLLSHELRGRQPVVLYASRPHFQQTNTGGGYVGETARGLTEANKRRIALPYQGPLAETDHVLGHELVHAFQFDMTESDRNRAMTQPLALRMPLWFVEGMAEYLTRGAADPITLMWVRDAAIDNRLPTLDQINDRREFAFHFGHGFWAYIAGRFGDDVIGRILNAAARGSSAEQAFRSVLLISPDSLAAEWRDEVEFAFADLIDAAREANGEQRESKSNARAGQLNLAPALDPDGERLVYISNRSGVSVNMFVEDVESASDRSDVEVIARRTTFEFMGSIASGAEWSPDGQYFAFGLGVGSEPLLVVIDARNGARKLEQQFPGIGEIHDPTWSPDGRLIAFSGLIGGQSDLFIYDTMRDSLTRLTSDAFAELHPSWSPDGTSIAFATDRFSTDLSSLRYGQYQLALIDPITNAITELPASDGMSYVNPQWSRDGGNLYFVGNRRGLLNVYRLDVTRHDIYQVSNVLTGVAGLLPLSPALSAARDADVIAFTVYEHGAYRIERLSGQKNLTGRRIM